MAHPAAGLKDRCLGVEASRTSPSSQEFAAWIAEIAQPTLAGYLHNGDDGDGGGGAGRRRRRARRHHYHSLCCAKLSPKPKSNHVINKKRQ